MSLATHYLLDNQDRLTGFGEGWSEFAAHKSDDERRRTPSALVGRKVWELFDGLDTIAYHGAIFYFCRRHGTSFETCRRCDSVLEARLFQMTVNALDDERLCVEFALLWADQLCKPDTVISADSAVMAPCCSVCGRYQTDGGMIDPIHHPNRFFVPSDHIVCCDCRTNLTRELTRQGARYGVEPAQEPENDFLSGLLGGGFTRPQH